jgi:peptide/nickel transport system permease protein
MTLRIKNEDYVLAVRSIGGRDSRILFRHILPNFTPTLIVLMTLDMPRLILLESTLSFLGLGIQPPTPSWGGMVSEGRAYLDTAWWIGVSPGIALLLTTLSINRLGDWLRAALDPALRQSA